MKGAVERYIDRVMAIADVRDPQKKQAIRNELSDHLDEKIGHFVSEGVSETEAILKSIEDLGNPTVVGYRFRTWRLIDVRLTGTARGVIAIGPRAIGVVAVGGLAMGVLAVGGCAIGLIPMGGLALGLVFAYGGFALAPISYGGFAVGALAMGGYAVGVLAMGGKAMGMWVPGAGQVMGTYYTADTVPVQLQMAGQWLRTFTGASRNQPGAQSGWFILTASTMLIMWTCVLLYTFLQLREKKRIREIDPYLAGE